MKRIISGIILAMLVPLLVMVSVPAEAVPVKAGVSCINRSFSDHDDVEAGEWLGTGGHTWYLTATVNYKYCYGTGIRPFFKVRNVVGKYNREGTIMNCLPVLSTDQHVTVKFYFWDYSGRNFDVQRFTLPCQTDTTASKQIGSTSLGVPLYGADNWGEPKWRSNFHVTIKNRTDGYRTLSGRLYRIT